MEKLNLNNHIEEQIADQMAREKGRKMKPVPPLQTPVIAKQHTPVYRMHRYFARRPWNVFEHIIKHYTNPGDLILDPFCGGGVTVYEGLKLRRRVIGIDLNPLATWITRMQVQKVDLEAVEQAFNQVVEKFEPTVRELYATTCNECGAETSAEWFEWSNTFICPGCRKKVVLADAKKLRGGTYECTNKKCLSTLSAKECLRGEDVLINKKINCSNCGNLIQKANEEDKELAAKITAEFEKIVEEEKLFIPKIPFPDGDRARDDAIFDKGVKYFSDLFTERNLISLSGLKKIILNLNYDHPIAESLLFIFSDTLRFTNKLMSRNPNWRGNNPEWAGHTFWMPNIFNETNILTYFNSRKNAFFKGKNQSENEVQDFSLGFPSNKFTYHIINQSSESTILPSKSIDGIITDPPFGGNVQYAELSDFWVVWLPEVFGIEGIIDNSKEAIATRNEGFETAKSLEHYEKMLYNIFKECHRVLKDDGYMVMTFHNKDVGVWMALHRAAHRAGFKLPERNEDKNHGMIYQDYIKNFKQTFHTRAPGSLLGDFILTFKKVEEPAQIDDLIYDLSTDQQKKLETRIRTMIEYHGGLDNTSIGNLVVEALADMNLLHRFAGSDLSGFYKSQFVYSKRDKKWYTREMMDPENGPVKVYDVLPVERAVEQHLYSFFQEKKSANQDELLFFIFTKLINSQRPGMDIVQKVVNRCCERIKKKGGQRDVYMWKTTMPKPSAKVENNQIEIFDTSEIGHNEIIGRLAREYCQRGFSVHIGRTEVRKVKELGEISIELDSYQLGIPSQGYDIIKEIDLLVLKEGKNIVKAIEVVTTFSTFNKAINDRFRNLLSIISNLNFDLEVHLYESDFERAVKELNTPANVEIGLNRKVKLIKIK